ncbi:histone H1-like [Heptranchias perlo]|uniref:histone H1-like n=1 Tax=Heptranchias perlo TaxID=212740 RepID=UPI00355994F0
MTDTAAAETAAPTAAQTNAPKKKKKAVLRPKTAGPSLGEEILKIVADCKDRKGISLAAIKKIKGTGASGSFRVAKKETQAKVGKKLKKQGTKKSPGKKPAVKKTGVKKLTAKKPAVKKPVVKKSTTKKAAKSPIKKKAAAKKPKTPKTVKAKKVHKPRARPKQKSAKPKKSAGKKNQVGAGCIKTEPAQVRFSFNSDFSEELSCLAEVKEAKDWVKVAPSGTAKFFVITSRGSPNQPSAAWLAVAV